LLDAGMISEENFGDLKKSGWSRASRTDKGVHAVVNAINLKIQVSEKFLKEGATFDPDSLSKKAANKDNIDSDKIIQALNNVVNPNVKFFAIRKVTRRFSIKVSARSRLYEYLLPVKAFYKFDHKDEESLNKYLNTN
jgi:tRNA pseudouridine38-40 synthase